MDLHRTKKLYILCSKSVKVEGWGGLKGGGLGYRERSIYVWGWESCHLSMHVPHTETLLLILPLAGSA